MTGDRLTLRDADERRRWAREHDAFLAPRRAGLSVDEDLGARADAWADSRVRAYRERLPEANFGVGEGCECGSAVIWHNRHQGSCKACGSMHTRGPDIPRAQLGRPPTGEASPDTDQIKSRLETVTIQRDRQIDGRKRDRAKLGALIEAALGACLDLSVMREAAEHDEADEAVIVGLRAVRSRLRAVALDAKGDAPTATSSPTTPVHQVDCRRCDDTGIVVTGPCAKLYPVPCPEGCPPPAPQVPDSPADDGGFDDAPDDGLRARVERAIDFGEKLIAVGGAETWASHGNPTARAAWHRGRAARELVDILKAP